MSDLKRVCHSAENKVLAIKRHLINKEEVSVIWDDIGIHPNLFYEWQKKFFSEGDQVFLRSKEKKVLESKVKKFSEQAKHKDSIISELVTELIDLKKSLGED